MKNLIIDLGNYENSQVGAKAHNLFLMKKNQICTPDFFCIDSSYLEEYIGASRLEIEEMLKAINSNDEKSLEAASLNIRNIINEIKFDEGFKLEVHEYIEKNFGKSNTFSVRSSSTAEDGADNSFAGQFETYLNVSAEDIFEKIRGCLASLFSTNIFKYCLDKGINISSLRMSIIIQEMIDAEASGIVFTANPRGLLNEMVIAVGNGTGNMVVEDRVPTTSYYYNTSDSNCYYEKQENSPLLDKNIIHGLIESVNTLKEIFSEYIDIEFALQGGRIYILQARPITTLHFEKTIIFDNSNIVESYPDITLPLTASFVREAYYGVFHGLSRRVLSNRTLADKYDHVLKEMVDCVNGRMYYNINNWYTLIKCLPLSKKIIPVWQEMLGVSNKHYNAEKIDISIWQKIKTYLSVIKHFLSVPKEMEKLNKQYLEVTSYFRENYKENLDNCRLKELYNNISERVLKDWDITLLNDMYAFIFTGLLKHCLKKTNIQDNEAAANKYISGISNIESMKPVRMLTELALLALKENLLEDLGQIKNSGDLEKYLADNPSKFTESFREYIDIYGDRSFEELKLESSTFRADPLTLIKKVLEYAEDSEKLLSINHSFKDGDGDRLLLGLLEKYNWLDRHIINVIASKAMLGIGHREASRLNRSRIYGMVRTIFLTVGKNFYSSKLIENREDIFYLETEEIFNVISGHTVDLKALVSRRKQEYLLYEKLPNCSRLVFAGNIFNKKHSNINSEAIHEFQDGISGIPCSGGLAQGEIIVVDNPNTVKDFKDKILVTKMTDPGWVFLLTLAKGIIAEKGSLLSHTAIISRELNIPSIVGVKNITSILKTGDIVSMDGNTGEIHIEKRRNNDV